MSTIHKFGNGRGITQSGTLICATHGIAGADPFPAAPAQVTISSSSIEDAPGGLGTSVVKVFGLRGSPGSTYADETTVQMFGPTPVEVWPDAFRIYRVVSYAGSANVGDIRALHDGNLIARMPPGNGTTQSSAFSIDDKTSAHFTRIHASMLRATGTSPRAEITTYTKTFQGPWRILLATLAITPDSTPPPWVPSWPGPQVPAGSDMKMVVENLVGTEVDIFADYDLCLVRH